MKSVVLVNPELLEEKISASGLKVGYIVQKLGISAQAFYKKRKGTTPFRASEIFALCLLLKISDDEKPKIFYPKG